MADYKILTIPFARDAVPDMVNDIPNDPNIAEPQLASFKQGFPSITTIPLTAGGSPPEGQDFNGILRDITEHIVHQNKGGMYKFEPEVVSAGGYPKGSVLAANDNLSLWVSLVDANVQDFNSGTPTQWARIAFSGLDSLLNSKVDKTSIVHSTGVSTTSVMSQNAVTLALAGADKFNAAAVTVASASTVDLTTAAPNTSQIVISGTAAINGFTVAAGRAFVVKFSGSCTLVNGASLVTGTGGNIAVTAGSTCIIRATAANVVEVVGYVESSLIGTKVTTFAKTLLDDADAAGARGTLGLDALLNTKADKAVSINAGTGLTGGGDLSANRTLSVSYGTAAGTAAQGDDSRITGAAQKSANLSDLANAATARTNLGLGTAATANAQTSSTDTTAGALMAVGAGGWLGAAEYDSHIAGFPQSIEDNKSQIYRRESSDNGVFPHAASFHFAAIDAWGRVRINYAAPGAWIQGGSTINGTGWTAELYHTGNVSAFAKTLLDDADAAAARGTLDVYSKAEANGTASYIANSIAIGVGQTWQNVTASRAKDTIYTNSTGRPIQLHITGDLNVATLTIGGVALNFQDYSGGSFINTIIPNNTTYSLTWSGSAPNLWAELR